MTNYEFEYQMLARLKSDCDYFLGPGGKHTKFLWALDVNAQIDAMKTLWKKLPIKPEWLTWDKILDYEQKMTV